MPSQSYPIASTAIARVEYDDVEQILLLTFKDRRSYIMQGVPAIEVDRLINAESPGSYWNLYMKGRY